MRLIKKTEIDKPKTVYNLHVKNNHNYVANGAVVKNCHGAKASSLKKIMEAATTCRYRFGTTGTLDETEANPLVIQGLLGKKIDVASTQELVDAGYLSKLDIKICNLVYSPEDKKETARQTYVDEISWITQHQNRINLSALLAQKQRKKVLFLFSYREHGAKVHNAIKKLKKDNVYYIDGNTPVKERERIRKHCAAMPENETYIIVASYQVYATGINLPNIQSVILGAPSKSMIRVLQSIGRGLRKTQSKTKCDIYDLVDDLRHKTYINYAYKHHIERLKIYVSQNFTYSIFNVSVDENK